MRKRKEFYIMESDFNNMKLDVLIRGDECVLAVSAMSEKNGIPRVDTMEYNLNVDEVHDLISMLEQVASIIEN